MIRVLSDCGLRIGELLALERRHWRGGLLEVRQTVHRQIVMPGTKTDHGKSNAGREVPVPAGLQALLAALPPRIDTPFLFPNGRGEPWEERGWYRTVWEPARRASGVDAVPHEFRHSWVSSMLAAGIDPADVAAVAGHSVAVMLGAYTHALHQSYDLMRDAVG
jgi:integrase